jgi:hypothetical protein
MSDRPATSSPLWGAGELHGMSRKLHREISRRWFRISAYDEQMVKNRASRSARTAVFVAASIASMPAIRGMALLMPDAVLALVGAHDGGGQWGHADGHA